VSLRLALSNPTLPEITDGYEIQLHHSMGHDPLETANEKEARLLGAIQIVVGSYS
jgi:hypothetical protein